MVSRRLTFIATILAAALMPSDAAAQFDIASGKLLVLLEKPALQEELGLPAQRRDVMAQWAESHRDLGLNTAQIVEQVSDKLDLSPEKRRRFDQVRLQLVGGHALLLDPGLVKDLKLSDEQKAELAKVRERNNSELRALARELAALKFHSIEARENYKDRCRIRTGDRLLKVLTPEQLEEFHRRQGPPFRPLEAAAS